MHDIKFSMFRENVDFESLASVKAYAPIDSPGPLVGTAFLLRG